jgi:hypothetical protein
MCKLRLSWLSRSRSVTCSLRAAAVVPRGRIDQAYLQHEVLAGEHACLIDIVYAYSDEASFSTQEVRVVAPKPVAPPSFSSQQGPAMSRCAHSILSASMNCFRKRPAVILPAPPFAMLLQSAIELWVQQLSSGKRHHFPRSAGLACQ